MVQLVRSRDGGGRAIRRGLPLFARTVVRDPAVLGESPREPASPVPTGLAALDAALGGGIPTGVATLVAARPRMGGSAFLVGVTLAAVKRGDAVAYFSEHVSERQLRGRLVLLEARVNGYRFSAGLVTPEDRIALAAARERILWRHLSFCTSKVVRPWEIEDHLFGYRPRLVIADLRPRPPEARAGPERFATLMAGAEHLAQLAAAHGVALLVRWILPRGPDRPDVTELPGRGALGAPFATVLLLHRDDIEVPAVDGQEVGLASMTIVRQDGVEVGSRSVSLRFDQRYAALSDR